MLERDEIDKFIDELSCDSMASSSQASSHFFMQNSANQLENQKLRQENEKFRKNTFDLLRIANEVLENNKNNVAKLTKLEKDLLEKQNELDRLNFSHSTLQAKYTQENNMSVNQIFKLEQTISQIKEEHGAEHEDYTNLGMEYLNLMSDVTCFFSYDVKKHQNPIISKTERFLYHRFKGDYQRPKIARKRATKEDDDTISVYSSTSTKSRKRSSCKLNKATKKLKTEINDFQSISQVASPASMMSFDEDSSEFSNYTDSGISFNDTLSPPAKTHTVQLQCRCHEELRSLVSVGTNTDGPEEPLPSLPNMRDDLELETMSEQIEHSLDFGSQESEIELQSYQESFATSFTEFTQNEPTAKFDIPIVMIVDSSTSTDNLACDNIAKPTVCDSSTSMDQLESITIEKPIMVNSSTCTENKATVEKAVNTTKSTTTRGTATMKVVTKNFSMQFPDISVNNILDELSFDLPDLLNPIDDLDEPETPQSKDAGTVTDLKNVTREIDYLCNQPLKIKIEKSSFDENRIDDMNGEQFYQLGKTVFDILLERAKQKYGSGEHRILRDEVWDLINSRLIEQESELDISFTDSEKSSEDNCQTSKQSAATKDGYEHVVETLPNENEIETEKIRVEMETFPDILEPINELDEPELDIEMTNSRDNHQPTSENSNVLFDDFIKPQPKQMACANLDQVELATANNSLISIDNEFDMIMRDLSSILTPLPDLIGEIDDLSDTIWNEIFPGEQASDEKFESPMSPTNILDEYDFDNDILEIPMEAEIRYSENDTPKSPEPFVNEQCVQDPITIPIEFQISESADFDDIMKYDDKKRSKFLNWKIKHTCQSKETTKLLEDLEDYIETYFEAEWTSENIEVCRRALAVENHVLISKAIFNVVEKYKDDRELCMEFTPPAPPLPRYLQKLILLIEKLSASHPSLPKQLVESLEENIFKCQKLNDKKLECDDLRNFAYYYSSLVDLFYGGDTSMVFYFIVKSIYYFEQRSIPMIFVLIKAFPLCLVKKSLLLRKTCPQIDWENMSGLEVSRVHLNNDDVDSLDLTVMFILTSPELYAKFDEIKTHELFNYLPKFYGFYSGQMCPAKLLSTLLQRLETGRLENLSLSLILFGRINKPRYTIEILVKSNLYPMLLKLTQLEQPTPQQIGQVCILLEVISSILKCFIKEESIKVFIPKIIAIYQRYSQHRRIRECCMKSMLRLQRTCQAHHKDIMAMLKGHVETEKHCISDDLQAAIQTFIYRKRRSEFLTELNPS